MNRLPNSDANYMSQTSKGNKGIYIFTNKRATIYIYCFLEKQYYCFEQVVACYTDVYNNKMAMQS